MALSCHGVVRWKLCRRSQLEIMSNPVVFFDIAIGGAAAGRIEMTLRKDIAPRTVENFR